MDLVLGAQEAHSGYYNPRIASAISADQAALARIGGPGKIRTCICKRKSRSPPAVFLYTTGPFSPKAAKGRKPITQTAA